MYLHQEEVSSIVVSGISSRDSTAIVEGQHRLCRKNCELRGRRDYQDGCTPERSGRIIAQQLQVRATHYQPLI